MQPNDTLGPAPRSPRHFWRILALVVLLAALFAIGKATGLTDRFSLGWLRETIGAAGAWGALLLAALFAVGILLQVPGMLFVAAAGLVYGHALGSVVALLATLLAVSATFFVVRGVGGRPLAAPRQAWVVKLLSRLERFPVETVALLRLVFWVAPPLNYALALSGVRFRHYLLGSALGLALPVTAACVLIDHLAF